MIKRLVQLAQIDQPFCTRSYGIAPCAAVLGVTGLRKCSNTRKTCQDPANYKPVTLTHTLASAQAGVEKHDGALPAIVSLSTTPGEINLGGQGEGLSPLGRREVVTIKARNLLHDDFRVDKYRLERPFSIGSYVSLPGIAGNYVSTPDSAALDVTGDIDIRVKVSLVDWTPPALSRTLLSKDNVANNFSYQLQLSTTGLLFFFWTENGSTQKVSASSVATGIPDGGTKWVRVTLDVNNGAGGRDTKFFLSDDYDPATGAGTWTQLGATQTQAGVTSIFAGTSQVELGSQGGGAFGFEAGKLFYAEIRNGIGGPVVAACNPADATLGVAFWVSKLTGETWTVNKSGTPSAFLAVLGAPYDPYKSGTFFGKFLARNPYHPGYALRVYEGELGQPAVQNLLQRSQEFTDAYWTKTNLQPVTGSATTYWLLDDQAVPGFGLIVRAAIACETFTDYVLSIKVKKNIGQRSAYAMLRLNFDTVSFVQIYDVKIDDYSGDIAAAGLATSDLIGVEDGVDHWRVWVRGNSQAKTVLQVEFYPAVGDVPLSNAYNGGSVGACEANGFQLQKGSVLGPYVSTGAAPSAPGMRMRRYVIDRIEGPSVGQVTIVAKDLLSRIEERKAVAPRASSGELFADITSGATSFQLFPTGIGNLEYPAAPFYACIGDEVILVGARSGDVCSSLTRGALGTVAASHKDEDLVQVVLDYTSQRAHNIVKDLLLTYAGLPSSAINSAEWDTAAGSITELYTARIAKPEAVGDLIAELTEQVGFTLYHDVAADQLRFVALRAAAPVFTVDDDRIVRASLKTSRLDSMRVSQVWIYYGQKSPVEALEEPRNYASRFKAIDVGAESTLEYGAPSIVKMFSRWIPAQARTLAQSSANAKLRAFRDPPLEAEHRVREDRLEEYSLAKVFTLKTREVEDEAGAQDAQTHIVTKITRAPAEGTIKSQQFTVGAFQVDPNKTIFVDNDTLDFNFRAAWEQIFGSPVAGDVPKCVITSGAIAGASSPSAYAFDTGDWPAGIVPDIVIEGRIQGAGGVGGRGGDTHDSFPPSPTPDGRPGQNGGPALKVRSPCTITRTLAQIWSGGGGGGGGGSQQTNAGGSNNLVQAGSGGGAGAGFVPAAGGAVGSGTNTGGGPGFSPDTSGGTSSTTETAGSGGPQGLDVGFGTPRGGAGGNGGGPGLAGGAGQNGQNGVGDGLGGAAGQPGNAIEGNAFVTWTGAGDVRGTVT